MSKVFLKASMKCLSALLSCNLYLTNGWAQSQVSTMNADVVVIGGGTSGISAAVVALQKGATKVVLLEDDIAAWIGADPKTSCATIDEYNDFCDQGSDSIFGKDKQSLVPIPGLYAAGVITSGWQGRDYHLLGSALGLSSTGGRIAGEGAEKYAASHN